MYSPKEFGELIGKSVITLQKWDRKGILKAHRSPTNQRYYTHDQYLTYRGLKALEVYCHQHTIEVDEWMQDSGSGLNYKRKQFNRLMEMVELGQVRRIVLAHRDRLVRFGYGYFEAFCERHNTEMVVIDGETLSPEQELVAMLTVFSARLHGLRSYKKVIKDAALQKDQAQCDGS